MRAAKANGEACEAGASYQLGTCNRSISGAVGNCGNCSHASLVFSLSFLFGSLALEIL